MRKAFYISFLFLLLPFGAEGAGWLGEYVGSEIPGYEIVKTSMILQTEMWTATAEFNNVLLDKARKACEELLGGRAIVNIRYAIGIGDVSFRNRQSGLKITTDAGIFGVIYGDCVLSVKPPKR